MDYDEFAHEWQDLWNRPKDAIAIYPDAPRIALEMLSRDAMVSSPPVIWPHSEPTVRSYISSLRLLLEELSVLKETDVQTRCYFELVCYSNFEAWVERQCELIKYHLKSVCAIFNDPDNDDNLSDGPSPPVPVNPADALDPQMQVAI